MNMLLLYNLASGKCQFDVSLAESVNNVREKSRIFGEPGVGSGTTGPG